LSNSVLRLRLLTASIAALSPTTDAAMFYDGDCSCDAIGDVVASDVVTRNVVGRDAVTCDVVASEVVTRDAVMRDAESSSPKFVSRRKLSMPTLNRFGWGDHSIGKVGPIRF
jgi:hypothetical protein